jgi:hypothetical protein
MEKHRLWLGQPLVCKFSVTRKTFTITLVAIYYNEISKNTSVLMGSIMFMVCSTVYYGKFILHFAEKSPYKKFILEFGILAKELLAIIILDLLYIAQ